MTTEKLISLVKPHPCLYNTRVKDYRNAVKKELLWERIARELKQSRDATKVKWKNLKDGYTKHKKSVKGTTGQKKTYSKWVWAPYLQFLDDYIEPRPTTSNIPKSHQSDQSLPSPTANSLDPWTPPSQVPCRSVEDNAADPWKPPSQVPSQSVEASSPDPCTPIPEELSTSAETPRAPPPKQTSSKKRISDDQDDVDRILDFLKSKKKKHDAVDHLFVSYAESFKKLKPRTQGSIKLKLAEMFVEAELQDLDSEDQPTHTICSPVYSIISAMSENQDYLEVEILPVDLTVVENISEPASK